MILNSAFKVKGSRILLEQSGFQWISFYIVFNNDNNCCKESIGCTTLWETSIFS